MQPRVGGRVRTQADDKIAIETEDLFRVGFVDRSDDPLQNAGRCATPRDELYCESKPAKVSGRSVDWVRTR
jgi:hypothetical protein